MKIKIKCSIKNLRAQGLPEREARRLSGAVVIARQSNATCGYYYVRGTGNDGDPRDWLFTAKEVSLVDADGSADTAAAAVYSDEELQFWQVCYAAAIRAGNRAVAAPTADAAVDDLRSRKTTCE